MILTGKFAYKIKKPVHFPFVDFSTLEMRRQSCDDELRLNRRFAKELYLEVVPIGGTVQAPRIGAQPAIEYAVRMIQFSPDQTLDKLLPRELVSPDSIRDLAEQIAAIHSESRPTHGEWPEKTALANLQALQHTVGPADRDGLATIAAWLTERSAALAGAFRQRERDGFVRECHGDLHLGNLVQIGDRIQAFDCIEFSEKLRSIDTIDEVAFLVMDFLAHGRGDLGFEFLNRYLELTGDYDGFRVLRFYLVHRALVRSYVRALAADQGDTSDSHPYRDIAAELIAPHTPLLLITAGLSGSGKTTLTQALIGRLPAVRIRSDLVRKRLHGLRADERSGSGIGSGLYSSEVSDTTYAALAGFAETVLSAGFNIIVDAAFLERARRSDFAALAQRCGVPFAIVSVTASESLLRQRVAARHKLGKDASEADSGVLEYQLEHAEPVTQDEPGHIITVDTGRPVDADQLAAELRRVLSH